MVLLLVLIGGGLGSFSKYRKSTMKDLAESNSALRKLKQDLEDRVEALEKELGLKEGRIASQQQQIETLERAVSRIESLNALQAHIDGKFGEVLTAVAALPR